MGSKREEIGKGFKNIGQGRGGSDFWCVKEAREEQ